MHASNNEFSFIIKLDAIGAGAVHHKIIANITERSALCLRFDLLALDTLEADLALIRTGTLVRATGTIRGDTVQACIASGDRVVTAINEAIDIRFVLESAMIAESEIELGEDDCDTLVYDGKSIDIGEAVAQSLGLALNPYPRSTDAAQILREAGVKSEAEALAESSPFAALAKLQEKLR